jgi:cytochrome c-type biogenesis protein CcmH/NrfF
MRSRGTLLVLVTMLLLVLPARGSASQYTPEVESEAARVTGSVMSPFCPGRLIADCPSPAAIEVREQIRRRIAAGESADAIKAELLETYGEYLRAAPTAKGFDLTAWLVPPMALAVAAVAVMLWMRRRSAKVSSEEADVGPALDAAAKARIEDELKKGDSPL